MKQKIIPIVSVLIGILAFFLTDRFLKKERDALERERQRLLEGARLTTVLAASRDIPSGTVLSKDDVGKLKVPQRNVGERAVLPDQVQMILGKKVLFNIKALEPILWSDVEGGGMIGTGLARTVNHGMRAISLNIGGAPGVSGMVQPNDRVDVLGTFAFPSKTEPSQMESVTLTVLQNVTVLATGQTMANEALDARGHRAGGYSTVTVEVSPEEAELLVFAEQSKGRLTLALRNPSDVLFKADLPEVNFGHLESELPRINQARQQRVGGRPIR